MKKSEAEAIVKLLQPKIKDDVDKSYAVAGEVMEIIIRKLSSDIPIPGYNSSVHLSCAGQVMELALCLFLGKNKSLVEARDVLESLKGTLLSCLESRGFK